MSMFASGPAENAYAITPDSNTDIAPLTRGVYVGTGGNLVVDMDGAGTNITFYNVASGSVLPIAVSRVYATSTADNIIGLV